MFDKRPQTVIQCVVGVAASCARGEGAGHLESNLGDDVSLWLIWQLRLLQPKPITTINYLSFLVIFLGWGSFRGGFWVIMYFNFSDK